MSGPVQPRPRTPHQRPGRGGPQTWVIVVAVLVVLALVASAGVAGLLLLTQTGDNGSASSPRTPGSATPWKPKRTGPMPRTDPALAQYYDQELDWTPCGQNHCAWLTVPMDYARPGGQTLRLRVVDVPATGRSRGSLVVNPGGPGGSGVQYAQSGAAVWPRPITQNLDLIGFDPRGVGQSTPLRCMDTAQTDRYAAADPDPDNAAERAEMDRMTRQFGEGCLRRSGQLARHMSTTEVAKDLDVLRQALGEPKLTYFGASYGTLIGATYANLFPTHVGRMVLDGAIDPKLSNAQLSVAQAHGFEVALRSYVRSCVRQGSCPLGDSVDAGTKKLRHFLDGLDRSPLPTSSGRKLTTGNATLGVFMPLYVESYWPLLTNALREAIDEHRGDQLLQLSDYYTSRGPTGYVDTSFQALYAVNCLDHDDAIPTAQVPAHYAEFTKASPTFGRTFAYSLSTCSVWPVRSGRRTHAMAAKGAPPIVVVGTTRDPATPLAWARSLADQLSSGVLVTRDGDGHTGFNQGNSCVDDAVEGYLLKGRVPRDKLSC